MKLPWKRRATIKTAVAPPATPENGNGTRVRVTTGEWDARVDAEDARADAALATCDAAVSAVRARRASGGHTLVKP